MKKTNTYYSPKRKRRRRVFLSIFFVFTFLWILTSSRDKDIREPQFKMRHGTAVIITGAAARISQEAALLEHLYDKGMLNDVVFISGASSGALNAAVLNAILNGKYTWKEYKEILGRITNDDIFIKNGQKLPVDTEPLRNLITRIVSERLGYRTLSDLPFSTSFSVVNLKAIPQKDRTIRLCNRRINPESDSTLGIVDVLMASTSYPFAFPPVKIRNVQTIPDINYYDGGIASDHVPYRALIEFEKYSGFEVEKMIIISRKRDTISNTNMELKALGIDRFKFFDKMGVSPEAISNRGFYKRLKDIESESPLLAERTYVYVPDFQDEFLMFDFSTLKQQYEVTANWAQTHEPVLLKEYLDRKR
jgi:predicted acylesterase/phospholipase RssA